MNLFEYTEKSIVLVGEDTKLYKDQIKDLFGKFNNFLKPRPEHKFDGGAGWIFSKSRKLDVEKFLKDVKEGKVVKVVKVEKKERVDNDEVKELRKMIKALERRVRKLETGEGSEKEEDEDYVAPKRSLLRGKK